MKWYFASNDKSPKYDALIKAAVESALQNTSLEPYFIYDGDLNNPLIKWLETKGVKIIPHRVNFYNVIKSHPHEKYISIASGAFLRCDIPILNTEDDFVLYTDCDVIFLKDFDYKNLEQPEYFSCSSENNPDDFENFNTGVMYMNLKKLRESHREFTDFITANLYDLAAFDQTAYQMFYGSKMTPLPIQYNYKPYWKMDENAVIIHFHGPKPFDFESDSHIVNFPGTYKYLFNIRPKNYLHYLELFKKYSPNITYSEEFLKKLEQLGKNKRYFTTPLRVRIKNFARKKLLPLLLSNRKNS